MVLEGKQTNAPELKPKINGTILDQLLFDKAAGNIRLRKAKKTSISSANYTDIQVGKNWTRQVSYPSHKN